MTRLAFSLWCAHMNSGKGGKWLANFRFKTAGRQWDCGNHLWINTPCTCHILIPQCIDPTLESRVGPVQHLPPAWLLPLPYLLSSKRTGWTTPQPEREDSFRKIAGEGRYLSSFFFNWASYLPNSRVTRNLKLIWVCFLGGEVKSRKDPMAETDNSKQSFANKPFQPVQC